MNVQVTMKKQQAISKGDVVSLDDVQISVEAQKITENLKTFSGTKVTFTFIFINFDLERSIAMVPR